MVGSIWDQTHDGKSARRNIYLIQPLTITYNMPVDLRTHTPDETINVRPGTNEAAILQLLYTSPHLGFTPAEIGTQLDLPTGSVSTTLTRLLEKGYIGKTADGLYHGLADSPHIRRFARSLVKLDQITTTYPNAGFGEELVEDAEETEPQQIPTDQRNEMETEQTMNDAPLGEDLVADDYPDEDT